MATKAPRLKGEKIKAGRFVPLTLSGALLALGWLPMNGPVSLLSHYAVTILAVWYQFCFKELWFSSFSLSC
jgi:hypothetical protein